VGLLYIATKSFNGTFSTGAPAYKRFLMKRVERASLRILGLPPMGPYLDNIRLVNVRSVPIFTRAIPASIAMRPALPICGLTA
jgi:hypothetical protein